MVLLEELEEMDLLQKFSSLCRKQLASLANPKVFLPGACIFQEGDHERYVYVVVEGKAVLEIKVPSIGVVQVHQVGPGDLLGWSPILGRGWMTATARAVTPCRLIAFDAEQVCTLAERDARFGMEFFRSMASALADRLRATRLQLPDPRNRPMLGICEGAD
jgi:CRP/FNR family cyclic AMP-dependent transcriptional regulator